MSTPTLHHHLHSEETTLLHVGRTSGTLTQTVNPPVQRGSTVLVPDVTALTDCTQVTYGRHGLATHEALREALCTLEQGQDCFLYPSGLAAITGTLLALVNSGDEVLMADSVYMPTRQFACGTLQRFGVTTRFFPPDISVDALAAMISPATKLIMLESPGSLTFETLDVPAIAAMAHAKGILTAIDNTWAAGLLFKPLMHGVDVSIQAVTKYIGGHSDVLMGAAVASGAVAERLRITYDETGWTISPDDAYLAIRGLRTLSTRMARHSENTLKIACWLDRRPEVAAVLCPALPGAVGHEFWQRDFTGICGLFGVVLNPVSPESLAAMLSSLKLFGLGFSWGGYESLVIPSDGQLGVRVHPPHFAGPLIRLHVGLEDADELIADLTAGLSHLRAVTAEAA